jgi:hypothetical protein
MECLVFNEELTKEGSSTSLLLRSSGPDASTKSRYPFNEVREPLSRQPHHPFLYVCVVEERSSVRTASRSSHADERIAKLVSSSDTLHMYLYIMLLRHQKTLKVPLFLDYICNIVLVLTLFCIFL